MRANVPREILEQVASRLGVRLEGEGQDIYLRPVNGSDTYRATTTARAPGVDSLPVRKINVVCPHGYAAYVQAVKDAYPKAQIDGYPLHERHKPWRSCTCQPD